MTVYQLLVEKQEQFSRKDLRSIANWINSRYKKDNPDNPDKIEQVEGDKTFMVFNYPDDWVEDMAKVIDWFFKNKSKRMTSHEEKMAEQKENKANPNKVGSIEKKEKNTKPTNNKKVTNNDNFKKRNDFHGKDNRNNSNQSRNYSKKPEYVVINPSSDSEVDSDGKPKRKRIAKPLFRT